MCFNKFADPWNIFMSTFTRKDMEIYCERSEGFCFFLTFIILCSSVSQEFSPNKMEYRGFIGEFTYDEDTGIFEGNVINSEELILFQGKSLEDLYVDFREAIEDYISWYNKREDKADKES